MTDINTFYLIDYENVGEGGLANCSRLDETDHIHIFYTGNTTHINLDILNNHGNAELATHKVPAGNQSVDMHLVSYLGYLIGANIGKGCSYVIISNDKDYDNVVKFLSGETDDRVVKAAKINPPAVKQKSAIVQMPVKNSADEPKTVQQSTSADKTQKKKGADKTQMNHEVQRTLSDKGHKDVNAIAKIVGQYYGQEHFLRSVHEALRKNCKDYVEIYKDIKPVIKKYGG